MEDCDLTIAGLLTHAEKAAEALIHKLSVHSITLTLAESCTGGLISALLAGIPGASAVLWGSFVCYTKEAKVSMLGLDYGKLTENGLVSRETACSMAIGALDKSGASLAAAVTGIAGPAGDGSSVPVGTVWIAVARQAGAAAREFHFSGCRNTVRLRAAIALFEAVQDILT